MNVLVIGAGITGALIGFLLRNGRLPPMTRIDLIEAENEVGGRMKTLKISPDLSVDIGAQYISTKNLTENDHASLYQLLIDNDLLEPLTCLILNSKRYTSGLTYFMAPSGMSSLVDYFVQKANFDNVYLSEEITKLDILQDGVEVSSKSQKRIYDIVVSTLPVPQFLNLCYSCKQVESKKIYSLLQDATFSTRFAFVMFYDKSFKSEWGAQYIKNDPIFRYVAIDNIKRNRNNAKSAVIFHTDIEFGKENENRSLDDVECFLKSRALERFPEWNDSVGTKCHRWVFSQVLSPVKLEKPFFAVSEKPLLILAGDSFLGSTFDNCITSAKEAVEFIRKKLRNS